MQNSNNIGHSSQDALGASSVSSPHQYQVFWSCGKHTLFYKMNVFLEKEILKTALQCCAHNPSTQENMGSVHEDRQSYLSKVRQGYLGKFKASLGCTMKSQRKVLTSAPHAKTGPIQSSMAPAQGWHINYIFFHYHAQSINNLILLGKRVCFSNDFHCENAFRKLSK